MLLTVKLLRLKAVGGFILKFDIPENPMSKAALSKEV